MGVRIEGVAAWLPERRLDNAAVERRIAANSSGFRPPAGLIHRLTGIRSRHVMADDQQASDLACAAAAKLLADKGIALAEVDLLIFASASQDMVEPATSHIVAAKLGLTCPVMDVKNACNSVLNGIEVADALLRTGKYRRVLIASGESPSRAVRWDLEDLAGFVRSFPGYTLSDAGAAVLLTVDERDDCGVLGSAFSADSTKWDVGTLGGGGSAHPRDTEHSYFSLDGARLRTALLGLGPEVLIGLLTDLHLTWDDMAVICVHQVSMAYLDDLTRGAGIPREKLVITLPENGNVASATLPLQLATALETGRCEPGDLVALVGFAGGVSMGIVVIRL